MKPVPVDFIPDRTPEAGTIATTLAGTTELTWDLTPTNVAGERQRKVQASGHFGTTKEIAVLAARTLLCNRSLQDPGHQRLGSYSPAQLFRTNSCSQLIQGASCTQELLLQRRPRSRSVLAARSAGENDLWVHAALDASAPKEHACNRSSRKKI